MAFWKNNNPKCVKCHARMSEEDGELIRDLVVGTARAAVVASGREPVSVELSGFTKRDGTVLPFPPIHAKCLSDAGLLTQFRVQLESQMRADIRGGVIKLDGDAD